MKRYFVTLGRELLGYCLRAEAPSKTVLAQYMNKHYGSIWCRITVEQPPEQIIGQMIFIYADELNELYMEETKSSRPY